MDRFRQHITNPLTLGCWFLSTAAATTTGPFGTYTTMLPVPRLIYWASMIYASLVICYVVRLLMVEYLPPMSRNLRDLILPFLFSAVFTPFLDAVNHAALQWSAHDYIEIAGIFTFNVVIAAAVVMARRLLGLDFVSGPEQSSEPAPGAGSGLSTMADGLLTPVSNGGVPRLFARLGCVEGRRVLRLTVDDHYVIVGFADGGEQRLLMRFADAVREMEGQDGFLTHRSHWVSADSVVRAWRSGGRDIVELVDGSTVPVSRTYRATLESRGLLGPLAVQVPAVTE